MGSTIYYDIEYSIESSDPAFVNSPCDTHGSQDPVIFSWLRSYCEKCTLKNN